MNKLLASSADQNKLALTLKGLIPLVLILVAMAGIDLEAAELNEVVESIINVVAQVGVAITSVMALIGLVRKIWIKLQPSE